MLLDLLVLAGVTTGVVGAILGARYWMRKGTRDRRDLVLLAAAAGSEEARLWAEALRRAGIRVHIRNVSDSVWLSVPYTVEVWVRPRDKQRAHEVLGL